MLDKMDWVFFYFFFLLFSYAGNCVEKTVDQALISKPD